MGFSEPSSEQPAQIEITPEMLKRGQLYASQDWVNGAHGGGGPTIYPFRRKGKQGYLFGEGHHRAAQAMLEGRPLKCELDIDLGDLDEKIFKDQNHAAQKLSKLGISGVFPFEHFLSLYKRANGLK